MPEAAQPKPPTQPPQSRKQKRRAFFLGLARAVLDPDSLRKVYVNGQRLNSEQLAYVARIACGEPWPDGHYWLDESNGTWGYVGQAAQRLPDCEPPPPPPALPQVTARAETDEELLERSRNGQMSTEEHEAVMRRLRNKTANSARQADFSRWSNQQIRNSR